MGFLEIWDVPWWISMATTRRGTFIYAYAYAGYGPWKSKRDYELIVDGTEAVWVGGDAVHFPLSPTRPGSMEL